MGIIRDFLNEGKLKKAYQGDIEQHGFYNKKNIKDRVLIDKFFQKESHYFITSETDEQKGVTYINYDKDYRPIYPFGEFMDFWDLKKAVPFPINNDTKIEPLYNALTKLLDFYKRKANEILRVVGKLNPTDFYLLVHKDNDYLYKLVEKDYYIQMYGTPKFKVVQTQKSNKFKDNILR